jgi:CHAD domain-containing protein
MPQRPKPTRIVIGAAFPQEVAATVRVQALGSELIEACTKVANGKFGIERIHALRIACRRYEAASELFAPCFAQRPRERLNGLVNDIRKAAGHVRAWDVMRSVLRASSIEIEHGASEMESSIRSIRLERAKRVRKRLRRGGTERLRGSIDLLIGESVLPDGGQRLFSDAAVDAVRQRTRSILTTLRGTLHEVEELHELRVELRRLRYLLEVSAPCLPAHLLQRATSGLAAEQECFGTLADATSVLDLLNRSTERLGAVPRSALASFGNWLSGVQASSRASILERIRAGHLARLVTEIEAWASESAAEPTPSLADASLNATAMAPTREDRLAVIDVGSNSVRLLVAEVLSDGTYKVIDDERECTRLGQGLVATGALSAQAMLRTAEAIARMRGISQGYGVSRLRVIGTSAVRDATNQREFLSLVREHAGVALDVLDGEDEARAAHRSVAAGFDITQTPTAVVDIGGGSTEVVLSARGAIEHLCSIRIGAVRLSEMCSSEANDQAVKQMRRYVRQSLARALPELPFAPALVVGTGGTFTALAALATVMGSQSRESSGSELRRSEVRHLLDRLGSLSLRERMRLPRLSPERADIIVAGAAIAEGGPQAPWREHVAGVSPGRAGRRASGDDR